MKAQSAVFHSLLVQGRLRRIYKGNYGIWAAEDGRAAEGNTCHCHDDCFADVMLITVFYGFFLCFMQRPAFVQNDPEQAEQMHILHVVKSQPVLPTILH